MRIWRNLAFLALVGSFLMASGPSAQMIEVWEETRDWYEAYNVYQGYSYFEWTMPNTDDLVCNPDESQEFEWTWNDMNNACIDWCDYSDYPGNGSGPGCSYHVGPSIQNYGEECYVLCNCLCI